MLHRIQIRTDQGELRYFDSLSEAIALAEEDPSIIKISFAVGHPDSRERCRLVRNEQGQWFYQDIMLEVEKELTTQRIAKILQKEGYGETPIVLMWRVDEEGLEVDFQALHETAANVINTTLIQEVLEKHSLDVTQLRIKKWMRKDRNLIVQKMYDDLKRANI